MFFGVINLFNGYEIVLKYLFCFDGMYDLKVWFLLLRIWGILRKLFKVEYV